MQDNNQARPKKKIPERKCLGCGESKPKIELARVVRAPDGSVSLDLTGKKSGRGAYVCRNVDCLKKCRRAKRIERSLEVTIPDELFDALEKELAENE
ncbi:MAG: YlxR family protein [Clostridia bacterium]|nr:YlxR family protein [Clostridia bacterium]